MNEDKIILLETKYDKILDYVIFIILVYYIVCIFIDSSPPIWFLIGIIIFFYGFIESSYSSSNLICLDNGNLVIHYNKFRKRLKVYSIVNIDHILFHRGNKRLDNNYLLIFFKDKSLKKYISFVGGTEECIRLFEGLKEAGIKIEKD